MAEAALSYASGRFDEADHEGAYLSNDDISLDGAVYTEISLTSDGEDEGEHEDEVVGLQAALAASKSEMENDLRQEELELQRAIEASKDADQEIKFKSDAERAIEISLEQERTSWEMRKSQEEGLGRFP
ncbi:hypothetical protein ARMSODRAFT_442932 [Armillaria solidipes]|uniref:Uncharacterized protein n=1 Tax=Armillaria solidipes TaxID=1076256 RepID=A0A2H3BND7_9AGAR|nr:hypothetical protein ARMSODRAFT_442932 [Armillaria solidipes]